MEPETETKKPEEKREPDLIKGEGLEIETSEDLEVAQSFDDLGIREELLKGIYAYGFDKPSAV
jgi:ATP-dependent RNA helicase